MNWYIKCLKQYVDFSGRARRQEYWMWVLISAIIGIIIITVAGVVSAISSTLANIIFMLAIIYNIAILLPSLAVLVRRLHDTGRSAWYLLLCLIPVVGPVVIFFLCATAGQRGSNQYGDDPKEAA